jgi:hypothetical protein
MSVRNRPSHVGRSRLAIATALAILIGASGCTVPPAGTGAALPGGPATIYPTGAAIPDLSSLPITLTPEQRNATTRTVTDAWKPLRTGDAHADAATLLEVIAKSPGFADAGLSEDGSVWARYSDGLPVSWIITDASAAVPSTRPAQPSVLQPPAPRLGAIPGHKKAVFIDWKDIGWGVTENIAPRLTNAGYGAELLGADIGSLLTGVTDVGVLQFATHGGDAVDRSGHQVYTVATSSEWDNPSKPKDLESAEFMRDYGLYTNGMIAEIVATSPDTAKDAYVWGITEKFVRSYWTFADDALIVIDACALFATASGDSFAASLTQKAKNHRATVLGWSGDVRSDAAATILIRFFCRVLGDNTIESPPVPRRPFRYGEVYQWMEQANEVQSPIASDHGTRLTMRPSSNDTDDGQLVPSVMKVNVLYPGKKSAHPSQWQVEIVGSFGPDPGSEQRSVTLGGKPLEIYPEGWGETTIYAKLPPDMGSPAAYGTLIVEVRGHPSNQVPLTQWTGTMVQQQTLHDTQGQGQIMFTCPVRITGDMHAFRTKPLTSPIITFGIPLEVTGPCAYKMWGSWSEDSDTSCALSGGGTYSTEPGKHSEIVSMSQAGNPNAGNEGLQPPQFFAVAPSNLPGQATGTIDCTGSAPRPVDGVVYSGGSYSMNQKLRLDASYALPAQNLDCNYAKAFATCTETWKLTPRGPIPTRDTQA